MQETKYRLPDKKVEMDFDEFKHLGGVALMREFLGRAQDSGWSPIEVGSVVNECSLKLSDREHIAGVLRRVCSTPSSGCNLEDPTR